MKWSKLGIRENQEDWLQDRVRATNSVFKILIAVLILLLINSFAFATTVMTVFIGASLVILVLTIAIHALGFHLVSRILTAILPVIVASCIQGAYQMANGLPNASGWVFIAAFQVLPFLLFAPAERSGRIISISLNLLVSGFYEKFNAFIELDQPPLTPPVQVLITNMIGLMMMLRLLYTIDKLYVNSNQANQDLVARIAKEKDVQEKARKALDQSILELNASRAEEEKRTWASKGHAEISKILRDDSDPQKMFDRLISYLVKYLSANQGTLFIVTKTDDIEFLELRACYAYERKKFIQKRFEIGEGLLGQCFHEKNPIYLTDVPDDYLTITSGLGLATPRAIVIIPMLMNDKVYGVIEVASFTKFQEYQIEFLKDAAENLAIAFNTMSVNEHTKSLLAETRMMAEQMKAQDEAMRQNMEAISAAQDEQMRIELELREIIAAQASELETLREQQLMPTQ